MGRKGRRRSLSSDDDQPPQPEPEKPEKEKKGRRAKKAEKSDAETNIASQKGSSKGEEVEGDDRSAMQTVLESDKKRIRLLEEEEKLQESDAEDALERLMEISDQLDQMEAYNAEGRASAILSGLQFSDKMKQQSTKLFSGGWRMRIAFACALFCRPTLLLLDEPTNHLDLYASVWLETYLQKWKNSLLIVSHDQEILNVVCTDIVHIHDKSLHYYAPKNPDTGAYDYFVQRYCEDLKVRRKDYDKQLKAFHQQQSSQQKDGGKKAKPKGRRKGDDSDDEATLQKKGLAPPKEPPKDYTVRFEFPDPGDPGFPVIKIQNAGFGYKKNQFLFKNLEFGVDLDSRIAIIGPNGAGKSTLLKVLTGELEALEGEVYVNRKCIVGRFNQRPIGTLSGGQKSRVSLAEICMRHPHILIFDEPTNHLDMESIHALVEALKDYKGGLVLVTHDSRLIRDTCNQVLVVSDGKVAVEKGGFDDYKKRLIDEMERKEKEEEEKRKRQLALRQKQREKAQKNLQKKES